MARSKSRKKLPDGTTVTPGAERSPLVSPGQLPSVDDLLAAFASRAPGLGQDALRALARDAVASARERLLAGETLAGNAVPERRLERAISAMDVSRSRPVLNATGIIVHTNLGRAPVSDEAAAAMAAAASSAVALEIDPATNHRGGRMDEVSRLIRVLTGAESTLVVNNNASAVLLVLSALGTGQEIVLSRGESVEIGGGFRIPDVLRQSGGTLVEVGTTNRTYAKDYERAITSRTAALLKIHPSNFTMSGFVHEATLADVTEVGRGAGVPTIYDQGNGLLIDGTPFGLPPELTVGAAIAAGADIVTGSGDKLLGGPQAGLICGSSEQVARISEHPWARAVRADKTCLAGIVTTLRHYLAGEELSRVPVWRMLSAPVAGLRRRADDLRATLAARGVDAAVGESVATPGGGSYPDVAVPSIALRLSSQAGADALARALRTGSPGVFGRVEDGRVVLDLRSVLPEDDVALGEAIVVATVAVDGTLVAVEGAP